MPERDWTLFLKDILAHSKKIRAYTVDLSMQEFFKDDKTYDAVMRNIQIIGEAIKHLPADVRKKYKNVDWKKAAGLRDIVVHEYFGINKDIIWDVITNKIPKLEAEVKKILKEVKKN
ncbi:MAG: DUF86 domain-containing protein [Nitrospiraceae bacterium]|nr:MAG: DUF86 domain-containing protein [Nitrospiraceae bacterium]